MLARRAEWRGRDDAERRARALCANDAAADGGAPRDAASARTAFERRARRPILTEKSWWTRSQRIRTFAEEAFEVHLQDTILAPQYQRIAAEATQLYQLGLSMYRIARRLGADDKTVAKAIAWRRSQSGMR
jgi:hypothetical protein